MRSTISGSTSTGRSSTTRPMSSAWGFQALAEGSARAIEQRFDDTLTPAESTQRSDEEAQFGAQMDVSGVPDYILQSMGLPYQLGVELVDYLYSSGQTAAVDAAFVTPPTTSEQVLHPELLHRPPMTVATPAADGPVIDDGVIGELGYLQLLHSADPGRTIGRDTVDGWAGDHYVAYTSGGRSCVRDVLKLDTPDDTSTFGKGPRHLGRVGARCQGPPGRRSHPGRVLLRLTGSNVA